MPRTAQVSCVALVVLGFLLTSCGDDEAASSAIPSWAKVAPEQIAEAKKHGVPVAFENDLGMRFVLIPAGTFTMGSPEDEEGRDAGETQHEATLTKPYYIQTTEVTNSQYRRFRPRHDSGSLDGTSLNGDEQPVVDVSWQEAVAFAAWVTSRPGSVVHRLPTEAEWEYACRAGTKTAFHAGMTISRADASFDGNCVYAGSKPGDQSQAPDAAGSYAPNAFGLHDTHGSVSEWCQDYFDAYPAPRLATDPVGPQSGEARVFRGGSWGSVPWMLRSASRVGMPPNYRMAFIGFRLVSPLPEK